MKSLLRLVCISAFVAASILDSIAASESIRLWSQTAPGETEEIGPERDMTKPTDGLIAGRPVIRIGNVSIPTITVYPAPPDKATGAAVLVCPGGAYRILAWDLEGTEVCEWLNSIGVTGVLLKYRVPARRDVPRHTAALQDAQRACGILRQRAKEWRLDPARIGVLGFSAGGHLAAALSTSFEKRQYESVDDADKESCRPAFAVIVYPGYLVEEKQLDRVAPELALSAQTPPIFLAQTEDDGVHVENSLFFYRALKAAHVPAELHIYPTGGHGYGLRKSEHLVTTWPERAHDWMRALGMLQRSE